MVQSVRICVSHRLVSASRSLSGSAVRPPAPRHSVRHAPPAQLHIGMRREIDQPSTTHADPKEAKNARRVFNRAKTCNERPAKTQHQERGCIHRIITREHHMGRSEHVAGLLLHHTSPARPALTNLGILLTEGESSDCQYTARMSASDTCRPFDLHTSEKKPWFLQRHVIKRNG